MKEVTWCEQFDEDAIKTVASVQTGDLIQVKFSISVGSQYALRKYRLSNLKWMCIYCYNGISFAGEGPMVGLNLKKFNIWGQIHANHTPNRKFWITILTIRKRLKLSIYYLFEIWAGSSSHDVMSALEHPLATGLKCRQSQLNLKTLITWLKFETEKNMHSIVNAHQMVASDLPCDAI